MAARWTVKTDKFTFVLVSKPVCAVISETISKSTQIVFIHSFYFFICKFFLINHCIIFRLFCSCFAQSANTAPRFIFKQNKRKNRKYEYFIFYLENLDVLNIFRNVSYFTSEINFASKDWPLAWRSMQSLGS